MGILKFPFANSEDIYLHDTPDHAKFGLTNRNLSNGCVRVPAAALHLLSGIPLGTLVLITR
jgi:murein L,D-transpeptidase YcbB/YkuD